MSAALWILNKSFANTWIFHLMGEAFFLPTQMNICNIPSRHINFSILYFCCGIWVFYAPASNKPVYLQLAEGPIFIPPLLLLATLTFWQQNLLPSCSILYKFSWLHVHFLSDWILSMQPLLVTVRNWLAHCWLLFTWLMRLWPMKMPTQKFCMRLLKLKWCWGKHWR